MLSVLRDFLLSLLVTLTLFSLQRRDLLLSQRLEVSGILRIRFPACRTELIFVRSNPMPTEAADLVATGARIEAQIVDLQWLHAQWTFRQFITAVVQYTHDWGWMVFSLLTLALEFRMQIFN